MAYTKFVGFYKSADKTNNIAYYVYFPIGEVKGIVQISHGMCEYFDCYEKFADFLTAKGFLVCGNDHLGHGFSVSTNDDLGYFSPERGWENAVDDLFYLTKMIKRSYPDLPYFLYGHSMGSFLARAYVTKHGSKNLTGAVFAGTSGNIVGISELLAMVDSMILLNGERYRSKMTLKLVLSIYNHKIENNQSDYDWVSRDETAISNIADDPKRTFIFTLNGYRNLLLALGYVSADKWFETYPKSLPTFFISGTDDPVGNYGNGVQKVYEKLKEQECNVDIKLYQNARHELVNEINRNDIYNDVLNFFEQAVQNKNRPENPDGGTD